MNSLDWLLPLGFLAPLASLAVSVVVASIAGLWCDAALRRAGQPAALRHAVIAASLLAMLSLPAIVVSLQARGVGWTVGWFEQTEASTPSDTLSRQPIISGAHLAAQWQQALLDATQETTATIHNDVTVASSPPTTATLGRPSNLNRSSLSAGTDSLGVTSTHERPAESFWSSLVKPTILRGAGTLFVIIWIVGGVVALRRFAVSCRSLRQILSRATPIDEPELRELGERLAARLRWYRRPRLLWSDWLLSPIHCGLLRPTIVLPCRLADDFSLAEWHAVLLHEIEHVARGDLFVGLIQRIASIVYWWNPLLVRLHSRLDDLREDLCDDAVLGGGVDRQSYARLLVAVADIATRPALPAVAIGLTRASGFTHRISRLVSEDRPMQGSLSWRTRLLLLVLVFGMSGAVVAATLFRPAYKGNLLSGLFAAPSMPTDSAPREAHAPAAHASDAAFGRRESHRQGVHAPAAHSPAIHGSSPPQLTLVDEEEVPADAKQAAPDSEPFLTEPPATPPVAQPELLPRSPADDAAGEFEFQSVTSAAPATPFNLDDAFSAEPGTTIVPSNDLNSTATIPGTAESLGTPLDAGVVSPPTLLLVSLSCDANGKLTNINFFNKPLGSDEGALKTLRDFVLHRAAKAAERGAGVIVHIEAPAAIRFDNVQLVTEVISDSKAEVRFKVQGAAPKVQASPIPTTRSEEPSVLDISVVFVRDASGKKLSSRPIVCLHDWVLRTDELANYLSQLPQGHGPGGGGRGAVIPLPSEVSITAENDVPYEALESVVQAVSQRGIKKVRFSVKEKASAQQTTGSEVPPFQNPASASPTDDFNQKPRYADPASKPADAPSQLPVEAL